MSQSRKPRRRGTLNVIGGLLITSAMLRVMDGTSQASAEPETLAETGRTEQPAEPDEPRDVSTLLGALQAREAKVSQRESELEVRLQVLAVTEAEVAEQLAALQDAEASLRATIALAEEASESDLGGSRPFMRNMKPKDAAALFEEMAPDFAAGFLGMMRPEPAALIMSQLTPQTAHSISVVLAGRNAGAPTQ